MSAILRSRVARQVLTSTRGFASVPEVMVRMLWFLQSPTRRAMLFPRYIARCLSSTDASGAGTHTPDKEPPLTPPVAHPPPHSVPPWSARPALLP